MKQGKAKGYRVAVKDDAGMLATHGASAVACKIYPVYQARTVPWQPVADRQHMTNGHVLAVAMIYPEGSCPREWCS
ncbi:hypothetical protein [Rhizobium laguerreae]|uniref:hypothetical protein n=1 Tax=Rhizobium laguerreae TaxID=1076926 RepID=UPI001C91ADBD|nr:hypothetical protein [Rhizobium laguerreae]MBY3225637.1 hypothetical protein [Rhizobium laguerreae]